MSGHFSFPACRRIARFFTLTYIPKYDVADILSKHFVEELAWRIYRGHSNLTDKTEHLARSLFQVFYDDGLLALEIMVCGMLPPESEVRVSERKEVTIGELDDRGMLVVKNNP